MIHLALIRGTGGQHSRDREWSEPLTDNLEGSNNVYAAAVSADRDSTVFASSNHVVGMVEMRNRPDIYYDEGPRASPAEPHRPDSHYRLTEATVRTSADSP